MKLDGKVSAEFFSTDELTQQAITQNLDALVRMAKLSELKMSTERLVQEGTAMRSTSLFDVRVAHAETGDVVAELARLRKEIERLRHDIASKERQLGDPIFLNRAPEKIVRSLEATLQERRVELQKLTDRWHQLQEGHSRGAG
jgi:valyl-tRNA synthetase